MKKGRILSGRERTDMEVTDTEKKTHRMNVFTAGDPAKPKLVFMAGSGTTAPMYDFKILYARLAESFRIIVIEKFGYGYSDLYEGPCDIDSLVSFQRQALQKAGEEGSYILLPHSMAGLEAIRWKQKYPDEIQAIIGLDMATPLTYAEWSDEEVDQRIRLMKRMRKLNDLGLLFWYPMNTRGLSYTQIHKLKALMKRNLMNPRYANEAMAVKANAETVAHGGNIDGPILMFVSDGSQVSRNWIENARQFAESTGAETIYLNCGHYVHYYESETISLKIREFMEKNLTADN